MALWAASFSKDPDTQVGAFIIDSSNRPLGWGYNGPPSSIKDEDINWERPHKYDYVEHAEENAIDFSRLGFQTLDGSTLYVTARPCKKCMLKIVKNKMAPPFTECEFDIMYNEGLSQSGSVTDLAVNHNILEKKGSWIAYNGNMIGQGREAAKSYLRENPEVMAEIVKSIHEKVQVSVGDVLAKEKED